MKQHARIMGALMMREIITRFGREGLGFLWLIGEPLLFCVGVVIMWSIIKPQYEHGIQVTPFVMTGYMCLLMVRHMISYCLGAISANVGLLYHRQIAPVHIFAARGMLEFAGLTIAFVAVYAALICMGLVDFPNDLLLLYSGWFILGYLSFGIGIFFAALAIEFEIMERLVPVMQYLMIPITGTFFMLGWFSQSVRDILFWLPIPHTVEMVRGAVFGEFVAVYYTPAYPIAWGTVLLFAGLVIVARARNRLDVE